MPMKMQTVIVVTVVLVITAFLFGFMYSGCTYLRKGNARSETITWEDTGPTPLGEKKFTPQGMTWVNGKIIFSNTWKDTRSRVYEIDPETMAPLRHFDMPAEAVHTSGLAWDGTYLWGVDHKSNRAYCIDLEASLASEEVQLIGSFDTTLKGTSACCIVSWEGKSYLAISDFAIFDFMHPRQTIFVRMYDALKNGTAEDAIDLSYRNGGLSQGLEFIDGYLYEATNKLGVNVINKLDLNKLAETHSARKATVAQLRAPSKGIEDLAWSGKALWTSDETTFRFYRGTF